MRHLKALLKFGVAALLFPCIVAAELVRACVPSPRRRARVLYYHAVPDHAAGSFRRQMTLLRRVGRVVDAASTAPLRSRQPLFAITFDDAFCSVADNAVPTLRDLHLPATVFAPTGVLGQPPTWRMEDASPDKREVVMAAQRLLETASADVAIGSHTVSHPRLSRLDAAALRQELADSRERLEALLGRRVTTIAFPYGDHDRRVVDACREAGYDCCFSIRPEQADLTDGFVRGRFAINADDGLVLFLLKASGAAGWAAAAKRRAAGSRPTSRGAA